MLFFNSRCSEKETLETVSDENPGIREARGEACEWSAVRVPSQGHCGERPPGLRILEWRRVSLSGDDITRQSWNAQSRTLRGPGASRRFGYDITKGLLTILHPRETTETWV